jgi:hypothetical protein
MDQPRVDKTPKDRDPLSSKRMMRIFNDNLTKVFLGSMSLA